MQSDQLVIIEVAGALAARLRQSVSVFPLGVSHVTGLLVVLAVLASVPQHTFAQESVDAAVIAQAEDAAVRESTRVTEALQRQGTVSFRGAPLAEVILLLSEEWNVNIVAGADVTGEVTASFKDDSLEHILNSILTANGYSYREIGHNLVILAGAGEQGANPSFSVKVVDLPSTDPEQLSELLTALKTQMSPNGELLPVSASGKLTIHDAPERIEAVTQLLSQLTIPSAAGTVVDNPLPTAGAANVATARPISATPGAIELRPQYITAQDLQEPLSMIAGEGTFAIVAEENVVVVMGGAELQDRARLLMQQLDRPRQQVRITGYIYDVALEDVESLGVDFNHRMMSSATDANGIPRNLSLTQGGLLIPNAPNNAAAVVSGVAEDAAATAATAAAGGTGGQFMFRTLHSQFELATLVQALDESKGSRLLADPHVTVVDRHTASLDIVTKIPVQQLTQTSQGGNIGSTTFEEAGIKLEVTPRIANDGTIELEVTPEFSSLSGYQDGNPIIDSRRATTVVRVSHGESLVIGGLRSKTVIESVRGIPGLMNIKGLGCLFRVHSADVRESEMIVLIMPEIVGYCGGLPREMHALEVQRSQLSAVQTATDGPIMCDCKDKHCPHHHPKPRFHNGLQDNGLIGGYDPINMSPVGAAPHHAMEEALPYEIIEPERRLSPNDKVDPRKTPATPPRAVETSTPQSKTGEASAPQHGRAVAAEPLKLGLLEGPSLDRRDQLAPHSGQPQSASMKTAAAILEAPRYDPAGWPATAIIHDSRRTSRLPAKPASYRR